MDGGEMTEYERQVLQDLSVLKSQMQQLMGIGQPGRLHLLEERVETHEKSVQRMKGFVATFGGFLTFVHLVIAWVSGKHS